MKRMVVIGGVVIALIAVIKIGSIFIAPSDKAPTDGKGSTEESYEILSTQATTVAREPVTIEIENEGDGGFGIDPLETLPEDNTASLEAQGSDSAAGAAAAGAGGTTAATTAAATKAAVKFTVKDMESKTMYAIKGVRIRENPSTDSEVVGGLTAGQDVKATGETDNGWIRVSYNGSTAYVSKSFLSTNKADVVLETTAAKKSDSSKNSNTTKSTTKAAKETIKAPKETSAAAPTTASNDETIAPFPG